LAVWDDKLSFPNDCMIRTQGGTYSNIRTLRSPLWLDDKVVQTVSLAVTNCVIFSSNVITTGHHGFPADRSNSHAHNR